MTYEEYTLQLLLNPLKKEDIKVGMSVGFEREYSLTVREGVIDKVGKLFIYINAGGEVLHIVKPELLVII